MSIEPENFYLALKEEGINFFTGVPDSLLKEFCLCVDDNVNKDKHIIAANEGNAVALAAGYYLADKSIPLVYMQNSGLGNAINPLMSLCDPDVYSIPMLIMIGWRGEPGVKDEPQHVKQGAIQIELLNAMDIPFEVISNQDSDFNSKIKNIIKRSKSESRPVAILIKKETFNNYKIKKIDSKSTLMNREEALEIILDSLHDDDIVISTTGKTSREIFEIRYRKKQKHEKDFLTVGSMGHCSSIALGIAIAKPERRVICIDGDGSMLMHLGSLTSIATTKPNNFIHILMNNGVHESVGGQETAAKHIDLSAIVSTFNVSDVTIVKNDEDLRVTINNLNSFSGSSFIEVKIKPGSRDNLGRPTIKPINNKIDFMDFLK